MRRNYMDIAADILKVAEGGARKTYLVYQANLNFKIIRKYLARLIDNGFLDYDGKLYHTTPRGLEFLWRYDALQSLSEAPPLFSR